MAPHELTRDDEAPSETGLDFVEITRIDPDGLTYWIGQDDDRDRYRYETPEGEKEYFDALEQLLEAHPDLFVIPHGARIQCSDFDDPRDLTDFIEGLGGQLSACTLELSSGTAEVFSDGRGGYTVSAPGELACHLTLEDQRGTWTATFRARSDEGVWALAATFLEACADDPLGALSGDNVDGGDCEAREDWEDEDWEDFDGDAA